MRVGIAFQPKEDSVNYNAETHEGLKEPIFRKIEAPAG